MKNKATIILTIIFSILIFASCKHSNIPKADKAINFTDEEFQTLASTASEEDLKDSWGEPKQVKNERLWPVEQNGDTRYLVAWIENGKPISIHSSKKLYITIVADGFCIFGWDGFSTDKTNLSFMPEKDIFGNEIKAEPGDQLIFESDGMVFESYPAQLGAPYEVRHKGSLTDEEFRSIDVELPTEKAAD